MIATAGPRRVQSAQVVHEAPRGVGVVEVEVAEREPGVLLDVVPPARRAADAVPRAVLVRVLAVAQRLAGALEREVDELGGAPRSRLEPRDDLRVERGGARERGDRERAPGVVADGVVVGVELLRAAAAYCDGSVTTVTNAWFFAAARTIAGPPTSMVSMPGSWANG